LLLNPLEIPLSINPLFRFPLICGALAAFAGCNDATVKTSGALTSYEKLTKKNGLFARTYIQVNQDALSRSRTLRIIPLGFSVQASGAALTGQQQALIANAISRTLCNSLNGRFQIVGENQPADLTLNGAITFAGVTNPKAAGVSSAGSAALSAAGVPFVPRLPVGMGALSVEIEAIDARGEQAAVMVWARKADAFTSRARVSAAGDAYDLASTFANDFSALMTKGSKSGLVKLSLPTAKSIKYAINGKPTTGACAIFGKAPGLAGSIAKSFAAPPEWNDKGATGIK
jgi:Protein of unknown function (DUF3313)